MFLLGHSGLIYIAIEHIGLIYFTIVYLGLIYFTINYLGLIYFTFGISKPVSMMVVETSTSISPAI